MRGNEAGIKERRAVMMKDAKYWKQLIGTGGAWFLYDISYYGTASEIAQHQSTCPTTREKEGAWKGRVGSCVRACVRACARACTWKSRGMC